MLDIKKIRNWFPHQKKTNMNDLVLHFRGGDRLFYKNEFDYKPSPESFISAIDRFEFDKLYIVTDMPFWNYITAKELEKQIFHVKVKKEMSIPIQSSVNYFNSIVNALPVVVLPIAIDNFDCDFAYCSEFKIVLR